MKKILIFALIYRIVQYFFYYLLEQKNHVEDNIDYDFFLDNNHFLNYNLIYLGTYLQLLIHVIFYVVPFM